MWRLNVSRRSASSPSSLIERSGTHGRSLTCGDSCAHTTSTVIHVVQQKAMALARVVASGTRTPVLLHLQDPDRPGMLRAMHSLYARPTDRLVGVSQEACGRATALRAPPPRVQVLHNAFEVDHYARRASVARQRVRAELGLAPDAPVVGTLSRLFPTKGHRVLF